MVLITVTSGMSCSDSVMCRTVRPATPRATRHYDTPGNEFHSNDSLIRSEVTQRSATSHTLVSGKAIGSQSGFGHNNGLISFLLLPVQSHVPPCFCRLHHPFSVSVPVSVPPYDLVIVTVTACLSLCLTLSLGLTPSFAWAPVPALSLA